jgi:Ubiquitin-protein ligase
VNVSDKVDESLPCYSNYISLLTDEDDNNNINDVEQKELAAAIVASLKDSINTPKTGDCAETIIQNYIHGNLQRSEEWNTLPSIVVNRNDILGSAIRAVSRKTFSFKKPLTVTFAGEEAVDTGGPKREFLRLLMKEVSNMNIFSNSWFQHD